MSEHQMYAHNPPNTLSLNPNVAHDIKHMNGQHLACACLLFHVHPFMLVLDLHFSMQLKAVQWASS